MNTRLSGCHRRQVLRRQMTGDADDGYDQRDSIADNTDVDRVSTGSVPYVSRRSKTVEAAASQNDTNNTDVDRVNTGIVPYISHRSKTAETATSQNDTNNKEDKKANTV